MLQVANLFAPWCQMRLDQKLLWQGSFGALLLLILKQPDFSTAPLIVLTLWVAVLDSGTRWCIASLPSVPATSSARAMASPPKNCSRLFTTIR